ncbi:MAG: InlB B-repeat-containing protein, partial [Firmicutes bacterium]|nr:InlB B-repeat-containing protein [Bacillota bacterium]
ACLSLGIVFGSLAITHTVRATDGPTFVTAPLFNLDGSINTQTAQLILNASADGDRSTLFRLFPDVHTTGDNAAHVLSLSRLNFRFTWTGGDRIAMWAVQAYRSSMFMSPETWPALRLQWPRINTHRYYYSLLRQNLLSDFTSLQTTMPKINNIVLPKGETAYNIAYDRIWLPSGGNRYGDRGSINPDIGEIGGSATEAGLWGFTSNSERLSVSLITTRSHGGVGIDNLWVVDLNGGFHFRGGVASFSDNFIRPALYLSASALQYAIDNAPDCTHCNDEGCFVCNPPDCTHCYDVGCNICSPQLTWDTNITGATFPITPPTYAIYNTVIARPNPTRQYHNFMGWRVSTVGHPQYGQIFDFTTPITSTMHLVAQWVPATNSADAPQLTWNLGGGTLLPAPPTHAVYGTTITRPEPNRSYHDFAGWQVSGTGTALDGTIFDFTTPIWRTMTLTAQWVQEGSPVLTWQLNGGSHPSLPNYATYNQQFGTVPIPTRPYHQFEGWRIQGTDNLLDSSTVITESMTLVAMWNLTGLPSVEWRLNNGSWAGDAPANHVAYNTQITEPANPTRPYHQFAGWRIYGTTTYFNFANNVTASVILVATWTTTSPPLISWNLNGGEFTGDLPTHALYGTTIVPPTPTHPTLEFAGWRVYAPGHSAHDQIWNFSTPITAGMTLVAQWTEPSVQVPPPPVVRTVTFIDQSGTHANVVREILFQNAWLVLPPNWVREGYTVRWMHGDTQVNLSTFTVPGDITITAHWDPIVAEATPSWFDQNRNALIITFAVLGVLGIVGLVILIVYIKRKKDPSLTDSDKELINIVKKAAKT